MLTTPQIIALHDAIGAAMTCEDATQVPKELTVAQWVLESGWGMHQPGFNCFGIKAFPGCYAIQALETLEAIPRVGPGLHKVLAAFAAFENLTDCFVKHAELITSGEPYKQAWSAYLENKDVHALLHAVAPIYATDPGYENKLQAVLTMPEVEVALYS